MAILTLKGVTGKGKNRIREHGEQWTTVDWKSVFDENAVFIQSVETGDQRWLTKDFEVMKHDNI